MFTDEPRQPDRLRVYQNHEEIRVLSVFIRG